MREDKRQEAENLVLINTQRLEQELDLEAQKLKDAHDNQAYEASFAKLKVEHDSRLAELDREQALKRLINMSVLVERYFLLDYSPCYLADMRFIPFSMLMNMLLYQLYYWG